MFLYTGYKNIYEPRGRLYDNTGNMSGCYGQRDYSFMLLGGEENNLWFAMEIIIVFIILIIIAILCYGYLYYLYIYIYNIHVL